MNFKIKKHICVPIQLKHHVESHVYADIIIQLIKHLLYARGQIPFSYDTFRLLINANKSQYDSGKDKNIIATRRYRLFESTLKSINKLFENLENEIKRNFQNIHQISILLGGTPVSPKEVYAICRQTCSCINTCSKKTKERCHTMLEVLRSLLKSDPLQQLMTDPMPLTNTYVLIKKNVKNSEQIEFFLPKDNYALPLNCTHVNFDFNKKNEENASELINEDFKQNHICEETSSETVASEQNSKWYQSTEIIKGIKDEMVNGNSIWQ